jgi:alanine racemase
MKLWLKKVLRKLNRKDIGSLITITISKSALLHNFEQFKNITPNNSVVPVLKSNAYGHGLVEVAGVLEGKTDFFVIDSYFEALTLRSERIQTPLLVMGYVRPEVMKASKLKNISYTIGSLDALYTITFPCIIHLKIDTGMHRQGILPVELDEALHHIRTHTNVRLEGICSHLADADNVDQSYSKQQINLWNSIVENVQKEFPSIRYIHLSNSHGHSFAHEIHANTSRLGIGLYGLADIQGLNLQPVMEMKTIVTGIKRIRKGDSIGYGSSFVAPQDMTIATIPVGYYEGLDRRLSNKGLVKIGGVDIPIIGKVSMNMTTVDVSMVPNPKIGDEVQVISSTKSDKNSIASIAKLEDAITYEVVVKIPREIRRIVV